MTDITPVSQQIEPGLEVLSMADIVALEQKIRENKQAQLRGDPLPHDVTEDQLRSAIAGIRKCRGTMDLYTSSGAEKKSKGGGGAAKIEIMDLDGL